MHPKRSWWGLVFLLGCGAQVSEANGTREPQHAATQVASPAEIGARYLPETASDVLFVNRERLRQNLLGERLVKWSGLRSILPHDVPFASLEDWETRLLENSDWFYIAADPRSVGLLVAKADRAALEGDSSLANVRRGMAWPHADVYAVDYARLDSAPKLAAHPDRLDLARLAQNVAVAFVHVEPDQTSPIRGYRFSIGTDYGLNLEAVLELRPGADASAVAASFESKLHEAAASPMVPLFRVRTLLDHAVVRAEPHAVTISTSLSEVETQNLIQLLDLTHDELKAAGTLEAWARGIGERAAATQVFFQPETRRVPPPGARTNTRGGQASKLGSFNRNVVSGSRPDRVVPEPHADAELERFNKQNAELRKKTEILQQKYLQEQQKYLKEQTEHLKNKNEELRRQNERR